MMFRRLCESCGEMVVCSREAQAELVCSRCGGILTGPFAFPVPQSYKERVEVLTSAHYIGAVAERESQLR